jgi:hypothetical protein
MGEDPDKQRGITGADLDNGLNSKETLPEIGP